MKGILFKPWKIKAIADSSPDFKWLTRRLGGLEEINQEPDKWMSTGVTYAGGEIEFYRLDSNRYSLIKPRYQVGEVVYIKEAYRVIDVDLRDLSWDTPLHNTQVEYRIDGERLWQLRPQEKQILYPDKWHSPMTMPAWAARLFCQVLEVRPELFRFRDMSKEELEMDSFLVLEGGKSVEVLLKERYDGKWVWRYEFQSKFGG